MRFPGYPSNREADERARMSLRAEKKTIEPRGKTRKEPKEKNVSDAHFIFRGSIGRMRPSRETCLHRQLPLGMGNAILSAEPVSAGLIGVPLGRDAFSLEAPSRIHL